MGWIRTQDLTAVSHFIKATLCRGNSGTCTIQERLEGKKGGSSQPPRRFAYFLIAREFLKCLIFASRAIFFRRSEQHTHTRTSFPRSEQLCDGV